MNVKKYDVVIVGGGLAGVTAAIDLAEHDLNVAIICDKAVNYCASSYAQGGIAAIISKEDTISSHVTDTYIASGNIADLESVNQVVSNSNSSIKWLEKHGVEFDRNKDGNYNLHLEGGHSLARILHIKDYTGRAVISKLYERLHHFKNISLYSEHKAFRLIKEDEKCIGLYTYNNKYQVIKFFAEKVILASGGASGLYKYVTNATAGDGSTMIMAHDIGCQLENLEFTQFHPTCFLGKAGEPTLISEAIRGSGAVLETEKGIRIMKSIHERRDLAPRDIVARQIYINMQAGRDIYLNATHLSASQWQNEFPYIYEKLLENDIDPTIDRIPISPAAHYSCGGVKVDKSAKTSIKNLYAVGEVSCTGLHGANRLASNSLLECIVYALEASKDILSNFTKDTYHDNENLKLIDSKKDYSQQIIQIRQLMWDKVGLVRKQSELEEAYQQVSLLESAIDNDIALDSFDINIENYRKILKMSKLTIQSAIARKESIGSHYLRS
ncbi:L-aspartate oxidase [Francisella sp. LA112445]|uniref:L-aspartate oxidase n=1 Tax=Francisella sp. LA112445 TaxID=1395624 RepID=UPI001788CE2B|nr:L-aspartate oxidase [Francisella sp. LA112445]QIW10340.1 L-aspartate oxidase [Francisella sp. LA112445]